MLRNTDAFYLSVARINSGDDDTEKAMQTLLAALARWEYSVDELEYKDDKGKTAYDLAAEKGLVALCDKIQESKLRVDPAILPPDVFHRILRDLPPHNMAQATSVSRVWSSAIKNPVQINSTWQYQFFKHFPDNTREMKKASTLPADWQKAFIEREDEEYQAPNRTNNEKTLAKFTVVQKKLFKACKSGVCQRSCRLNNLSYY